MCLGSVTALQRRPRAEITWYYHFTGNYNYFYRSYHLAPVNGLTHTPSKGSRLLGWYMTWRLL